MKRTQTPPAKIVIAAATATAIVITVTTLLWPEGSVPPAVGDRRAGCTSGVAGDVNGDGFAEVAVGAPGERQSRGSVHLFYGYRGKLATQVTGTALDDQVITADSVSGSSATAEDQFGFETTLADFNGDGCADLAVGAPGARGNHGTITVFYGSRTGLQTTAAAVLSAASVVGPGESYVGTTLVAGDLDGDGRTDLISQATPHADALSAQVPRSVVVLYGAEQGLNGGRTASLVTAGSLQLPSEWGFGGLAIGDFDGNGRNELAVGASREITVKGLPSSERGVFVVKPRGDAYAVGGAVFASTPGFPGDREEFRELGSELAVGDVQGDGRDDLVLGDPSSGMGEPESEYGRGVVVLLPGSAEGLTTTGGQYWTPDSPGVAGTWEYGDAFGGSLALGHLDQDARDDLVIGASGSGLAGGVTLLLGGPTGLTTRGIGGTRYTQKTPGIVGTDERGDRFGSAVTVTQLDGDDPASVVIGASNEGVGAVTGAGAITRLGASTAGPVPSSSQTLTLDSPGVGGTATESAFFGSGTS